MNFKSSGVLYALLSAAAFAVMGYFAKHLSREVPSSEVVFYRGILGAAFLLPWCWNTFHHFRDPAAKFLILRGLAGAASALCYFETMARTTVANARAIADIAPLFVVILGWRLLGEKPTWLQLVYVGIGLAGTSLLGIPGAGTCPPEAWAIGVCGAVFASLAFYSLRQASQRFPKSLTVFIFMASLSVGALLFSYSGWSWPTSKQWGWIAIIGFLGMIAQVWMTYAYARLPAFLATAFGLSSLPMIAVIETVFDADLPTNHELTAYGLILLSVLLHAANSIRKKATVERTSIQKT